MDSQNRGTREAYERYLRGMDASMRQKVALTAAHLLCTGKVADMGMGSGAGSHALAALYPMLNVVGVDLDPTMVAMAKERFGLQNLDFVQGDIAAPIFPEESLDGIFDSSVLHHVTSFGDYRYDNAARCLETQARALKAHGVLLVRDFLAPPEGEPDTLLDLPDDDGDDSDDPRTSSSAALFRRFAREFRSLSAEPGFPLVEEAAPRKGRRRFRVSRRLAAEFVLRKDYRTDWEAEVKEEYAYFSQAEFESLFARLGLRVLSSTPIRNPWIVRNRFTGKFESQSVDGAPHDVPATNYVIAGEKVRAGEGVRFREGAAAKPLGFLEMDHYRHRRTGHVRDLVRRPHTSLDVVPYFEVEGDLFVVARMSYPRPILASPVKTRTIDESSPAHYVTEPLNVVQTDKPIGQTVEEMLAAHAKITSDQIRKFTAGGTYYPSPGGSQEEVRSVLVDVSPVFVEEDISNVSGFKGSGRIRALEAEQVLRAAQVGGLPDARLEVNVYQLLAELGRSPGPWIGEAIALERPSRIAAHQSLGTLTRRPNRRVFERCASTASSGFLEVRCGHFIELDARGEPVAEADLEYVVPKGLSSNTVACALLARIADEICIGVDDDDLPAAQCFVGNSELLVAPAWRLPRKLGTVGEARAWVLAQLQKEYGLTTGEVWELGGAYHPSAGMSPEVVFPMAVEVLAQESSAITWFPLREVGAHLDALRDGHLRICALRAAHALNLLEKKNFQK